MLRRYGTMLGKGFLAQEAPRIVKGALIETLKAQGIGVKGASKWVEENACLWDTLQEGQQRSLVKLRRMVGRFDWFTAEWVIEVIKDDLPSVASLFLGWKKGNNWLKRQVEIINERVDQ